MTRIRTAEIEIVFLLLLESEVVGGLPHRHELELLGLLLEHLLELLQGRPRSFLSGANFDRGVRVQRAAQVVALVGGQEVQLRLLQGLGEPLACSFRGLSVTWLHLFDLRPGFEPTSVELHKLEEPFKDALPNELQRL